METHKAIIKGEVLKLKYVARDMYFYSPYGLGENNGECWVKERRETFVRWEEIWSGEINSPLLDVDELFYIEELDLKVRITERIRTNSGSYIYETDHIIEVIEDEETRESDLIAEEKIKEIKAKGEDKYESNLAYIRREEKPGEEKSWFERWFG